MYRREMLKQTRQWSALRRFARRAQETACQRPAVRQEWERIVRRAHRRLAWSSPGDLLPALPGVENRLYALFAD